MKRLIGILLPILILGSLITWRLMVKRTEAAGLAQQRQARAHAVPQACVAAAELRDIQSVFEATGTLEAPLNVKISPKISGRVEYLTAHEGDRVSKGQVLVRLDGSQIEADVRRAQAAVAEAQYRLAQAQTQQGPNTASVSTQIKQQKAVVASARADLDQVEKNLASQVAAAQANVTDIDARIASANAGIASAKANISRIQATLNNANTKLNRASGLFKQGYTAAQDVDDARAEVEVETATLDGARQALEAAQASRDSVVAQKRSAEEQVSIVRTKGAADVESARQKVRQADAAVELAMANRAQNPAYQQGLSALQAAVAAARADLANARAQRADTVLTSPLDGYVTSRLADPGTMATAGQALLAVQFFKQVWVSVAVPDDVSQRLRTGQPLSVTFDALPGRDFSATIVQINPSADAQARQFTVRAALDNPAGSFRPGMFAHVSIVTQKVVGVVAVPREAVQHNEQGDYVNVVDSQGMVHQRPVTTGLSDAKYVSIAHGLQVGEQVVTMCAVPLKEGQAIKTGDATGQGAPGAAGGASPNAAGAPGALPAATSALPAPGAPSSAQH